MSEPKRTRLVKDYQGAEAEAHVLADDLQAWEEAGWRKPGKSAPEPKPSTRTDNG